MSPGIGVGCYGCLRMVRYRRNFIPGGTWFFTVTLADRRSKALAEHVEALRLAFRTARRERPFCIDAIVVLPDHLHAILTLPPNDADFSGRWQRIKGHFSSELIRAGHDIKRWAKWRSRALAEAILGAHHPRRQRFCPARGLHPFQSDQARIGATRSRLASFLVSSLRS